MQILDGKKVSQAVKDQLKIDVAQLSAEGKKVPHLAAILVGNDGASETYVASKVKSCEEVGFKSTLIRFDADTSENKLLEQIEDLSTTNILGVFIREESESMIDHLYEIAVEASKHQWLVFVENLRDVGLARTLPNLISV